MFEVRFVAPNGQCTSGVLRQVVEVHFAKGLTVKAFLIIWTVAAGAGVRIVAKRVGREYGVKVLYGETKLWRFFHPLILPT